MATEKRLKAYDPITLESYTRHATKHREPYDQYDMGYTDAVDNIEDWLEANTVDAVEVVHGHNLKDHDSAFECSLCGWEDWDTLTADTSKYNYCPNCGAKMDGEKKSL